MNLYVTTAELKLYMGISGSSKDSLLDMLNKQATSVINDILGVSDLSLHKVTQEIHDAVQLVILKDMRVLHIGPITDDGDVYTQEEDYDIDGNILRLEDILSGGLRKLKVTYAAGWSAYGSGYIDIVDYSGLTGDTVTVNGVTKTAGVDWTAGTSNDATATSLATALDAIANVHAFAVGSRVYVIDDTVGTSGKTLAASDTTNLTLSGSTLATLDFPESLKQAVCLYVSNAYAKSKGAKVSSYSIGGKSVQFVIDADFKEFSNLLMPYMRPYVVAI